MPKVSWIAACCFAVLAAVGAAPAAATVGGATAPGGGTTTTAPSSSTTTTTTPAAPTTAPKPTKPYRGPVYVMNAAGQIVPYVPPANTAAQTGGATAAASAVLPKLLVTGNLGAILPDGQAAAPIDAPAAVQNVIWAGNEIVGRPYVYGGGHASFISKGYDCSGTVSYALHGGGLLNQPLDSSDFMHWGLGGIGTWITVFTNPGHAYMTVAGIRIDTSAADDPSNQQGPRWRPLRPANAGFTPRHPNASL